MGTYLRVGIYLIFCAFRVGAYLNKCGILKTVPRLPLLCPLVLLKYLLTEVVLCMFQMIQAEKILYVQLYTYFQVTYKQ